MDIGSMLAQLRGVTGALPTMQFGGGAAPNPAAPAVPADGAMQPTIGPGSVPPVAAAAPGGPTMKMGLPSGGLLAMMQGRANPQGLVGLLQQLSKQSPAGSPMAGAPPAAGMLGGPLSAPSQIGSTLPLNIKPLDMF